MIVSCPRCATGFALPDSVLGDTGRKVRCGSCGHVWLQLAQSGPSLDSPVTMEPAQAVISDAPGCLPPDLLEVDAPIGAGALDVVPIDLVVPDAGAEFAGEGEEAIALEPSDAEIEEMETAGEETEAEPAEVEETAEQASAPREAETAAAPAEKSETQAVATAATEKHGAIPEAWLSPKLAALAPLVAAIAEDKARHGDLPAEDAAPEASTPPAPDQSEPPQAFIVVAAEAPMPSDAADAALAGAEPAALSPDPAGPQANEPAVPSLVPVEIAAPELALLAATTFAPPTVQEAAPETVALPPIDIPAPPEPPAILVALRDDRAKEGDGLDAIAPPPAPAIDDDLRPEETISPEIAAANLRRHRRLRYGAVIGALALIAGGLVANEATQNDGTALLAAIKTGGAPPAETGLGFANVSTQRAAVAGVPMLMVTGEVVNDSPRPRAVPMLRGALLIGERELQIWTFNAGTPRLDPGQRASFETVLRNPANGATDVRVTFSSPGS